MEFPDKQWSGTGGVHFGCFFHHISVGKYVTSHIDSLTSDDEENFRKCITKVTEWNASRVYFFYDELYDKATSIGIWLLPWPHFRRGITNRRGFLNGDGTKDSRVIIPDRYVSKLKLMSQKIYNALTYKDDRLPSEGMAIVNNSQHCGYNALYNIIRVFTRHSCQTLLDSPTVKSHTKKEMRLSMHGQRKQSMLG